MSMYEEQPPEVDGIISTPDGVFTTSETEVPSEHRANCMQRAEVHAAHAWSAGRGGAHGRYWCDGASAYTQFGPRERKLEGGQIHPVDRLRAVALGAVAAAGIDDPEAFESLFEGIVWIGDLAGMEVVPTSGYDDSGADYPSKLGLVLFHRTCKPGWEQPEEGISGDGSAYLGNLVERAIEARKGHVCEKRERSPEHEARVQRWTDSVSGPAKPVTLGEGDPFGVLAKVELTDPDEEDPADPKPLTGFELYTMTRYAGAAPAARPAAERPAPAPELIAACTPNSLPDAEGHTEHGFQINVLDDDMAIVATIDLPDWESFRPASAGHRLIEHGYMIRPDARGPETLSGWTRVGPGFSAPVVRTCCGHLICRGGEPCGYIIAGSVDGSLRCECTGAANESVQP